MIYHSQLARQIPHAGYTRTWDEVVRIEEIALTRAGYKSVLNERKDMYLYIAMEFLVADFPWAELIILNELLGKWDDALITRFCRVAKGNEVYKISYLARCLENNGARAIEQVRQEQRIQIAVAYSLPGPLPKTVINSREYWEGKKLDAEITKLNAGQKNP